VVGGSRDYRFFWDLHRDTSGYSTPLNVIFRMATRPQPTDKTEAYRAFLVAAEHALAAAYPADWPTRLSKLEDWAEYHGINW
jgi:hypothetical protein